MKNKTAKQRESQKDAALNHSQKVIWNAFIMASSLKEGSEGMQGYEMEAQLEILSSYLGDAWEVLLCMKDTTE
jgi:hypothetical protein